MKKFIMSLAVSGVIMGSSCLSVNAQENTSAEVYVTIRDSEGKLVLVQEKIAVSDTDGDNVLSINDALYVAHEKHHPNGASGYESQETAYGKSLTKLWGNDNGGSYGYYLNNASPLSLSDSIKDGDYIDAYSYTDLTAWSDTYCYFEERNSEKDENEKITLKLMAATYDENWNPITAPISDAVITIDGEKSGITTNSEGEAEITIKESGKHIISAVSDNQILVAPSCIAIIGGDETPVTTVHATTAIITTTAVTTTEADATTDANTTSVTTVSTTAAASSSTSSEKLPNTGDSRISFAVALGITGCVFAFVARKKKNNEN